MTPKAVNDAIAKDHIALVDIRDVTDQLNGTAKGALCMSQIELVEKSQSLKKQYSQIIIMCYRGNTSKELALQLGEPFVSAEGGFEAWDTKQLPIEKPIIDSMKLRYQQQIKLKGFGLVGQKKLADSHVMVIGAGGLGAPALLYLVASGVGEVTLVDDDHVSLSNLHRQILYREADVGFSKSNQAEKALVQLNSDIKINAICQKISADNIDDISQGVDFIIDGTDNISSRYLVNDFCLVSGIPWVFAAISAFDIQMAVFHHEDDFCYRCLFPELKEDDAGNCQTEGVLGPVPGLASMLQATEAIKHLSGLGGRMQRQLLTYNVMNHRFKMLKYPADQICLHRKSHD